MSDSETTRDDSAFATRDLGAALPAPAPSHRTRTLPPSVDRPAVLVHPASPALSASPTSTTFPDDLPVPSTSALPPRPLHRANTAPALDLSGPSPATSGSGLAARRAAKLGKKRLSLVVPTPASAAAAGSLLSPKTTTTPSRGQFEPSTAATTTQDAAGDVLAETRSLPPSPISLVTFIGTEGSEQPDRTIGRLMLKQQADEMREQMRGGRGMKRRTSIPRLNLATALAASAAATGHASPAATSTSSARPSLSLGGGRRGAPAAAVQFLRRDESDDTADVEEYPYALGPREILPGIFLGSEQNAKDPAVLREWKFGFVLNVAKEVECPWLLDDVTEDDSSSSSTRSADGEPRAAGANKEPPTSPPRKHKHRRTKTQAANEVVRPPALASDHPRPPVRPPFIRPTASTPNLQSVFRSSTLPPVPPVPKLSLPDTPDSGQDMLRLLSSSPPPDSFAPVPPPPPPPPLRRSPPRARVHPPHGVAPPAASNAPPSTTTNPPRPSAAASTTCRSPGVVRFPRNGVTGRPAIEYQWLKWGHDEADLVEAHKFQAAFDFLDEAQARGERVLVHCQCGVSRSATVVIAYCMREAAKALDEGRDAKELSGCTGMHDTYSFVKEKSEWVGPNLGLVFQLVAYERTLRGDANDAAYDDDDDESGYPRFPPEPVSSDDPRTPVYPNTPRSLDGGGGSASRSEVSTPDLHLPHSPTPSNETGQSSATSTPVTVQLANGLAAAADPRIATPDEPGGEGGDDESDEPSEFAGIGAVRRPPKGGAATPAVFVLSPPPVPPVTSPRPDVVSPTVASYPSPAPSPLEFPLPPPPSKAAKRRRPPPISLDTGHHGPRSLDRAAAATTVTPLVTPAILDRSTPKPPHSLPALTTTGLSHLSLVPRPSLRAAASVTSPDSALTTTSSSSDSSGRSGGGGSAHPTSSSTSTGVKKFGAQSQSERRASHRRVFSETIQVPASLTKSATTTSWSSSSPSHSLHSAATTTTTTTGGEGGAGPTQ
ncbi:hypothetical protein JCM11491_005933 [Sporobolomyces phaffii]